MSNIITAGNATNNGTSISSDTSGVLELKTGSTPTTAIAVDTSQRVGIGTTSPGANLEVKGASGQNIYVSYTSGSQLRLKSDSGDSGVGTTGSTPLLFLINNGEKARIDSSGNLMVGTTAVVNPTVTTDNATTIGASGELSNIRDASQNIKLGKNNGAANNTWVEFFYGGASRGQINFNGSGTTYTTSSDYRLKNTIAPMTGALAKVAALKPVTYKWNADGSDGQGFIAHELAEVVPECVTGEKDAVDEDGKPQYQGIDTSFLVATLTAAIQELKAELDATKAEVAALKGA